MGILTLQGALVMLLFGLTTVPSLFLLGSFVGTVQKFDMHNLFLKISAVAIILYAIFTAYKGGHVFKKSRCLFDDAQTPT